MQDSNQWHNADRKGSKDWVLRISKPLITISVVSCSKTGMCTEMLTQQWRSGKRNSFSKFLRIINQRTFLILKRLGCSSDFHLTRYKSSKDDSYNGWKNYRKRIMVLLPCTTKGTDKHHRIVGRMKNLAALNMSVRSP
jgi:hypothetical protein